MIERWMLRRSNIQINKLSRESGVTETTANILVNRGIADKEEIRKFLSASLDDLHDPFLMRDMEKGVEIILKAILHKKNIVVYGDYDADGVTSTSVLYKALKNCGAQVIYYIPDREHEGYGMNSNRLKLLKEEGAEIIITCDNGISAVEQIAFAKSIGLTVVLTDHHEIPFIEDEDGSRKCVLPPADAVINPKQKECKYPFKFLCGAGIAFKFAQALYIRLKKPKEEVYELLEFAGIGTICDIVDLIGENRIIAKNALKHLNNTKNLGLLSLIEALGMKDKKISSGTVGFQIGPCINATGRLETAALSVELLLSEDAKRAKELAQQLVELNRKRQSITNDSVEEIIYEIENSSMVKHKVLVVYKENIHESIAGIVAGKVRERFNVPTIVLTKGKDMPKGSGRSINEYNLFEELNKCKHLISKFGGHPMAAGLSIEEKNINKLREELNKNCTLTDEDIIPKIRIDKKLPVNEISYELIGELEKLEPFGKGNESPILAEKGMQVEKISIIGKDSNVIKFLLRIPNSMRRIEALCFGKVNNLIEMLSEEYGDRYTEIMDNPRELKLDIIFTPFINEYNGYTSIQLRVSSFRIS